jgi:hypothetical protein
MPIKDYRVVALDHFIEATRDSGYKTTGSAIAELVDNAFEAGATSVTVSIDSSGSGNSKVTFVVQDNGCGMTPAVLRLALQFGGSTRFDSRDGVGRYGMGLPNSSLSQARRVEVYSWKAGGSIWWSYLDVDEIAAGKIVLVPKPKRRRPATGISLDSPSGTIVRWSNCDRLNHKKVKTLASKLALELGRVFRKQILAGNQITINGERVKSIDPLFLHKGANLVGASQYGPPLCYQVQVPTTEGRSVSRVYVTFSELPVDQWHRLSNHEKRRFGISKEAGVSIIRANREIDSGWFFMGSKRKENYDDWWRCEVCFDATLDELFGVTHTKQGIHPTDEINDILAPDIERIAHELNANVRRKFTQLKDKVFFSEAQTQAESRDYLLEPPVSRNQSLTRYGVDHSTRSKFHPAVTLPGFAYRIEHRVLRELSFYVPLFSEREIVLLLNEDHPFYERVYAPIANSASLDVKSTRVSLELLLFAAARAECAVTTKSEKAYAGSLRESWSNVLAAFLG